MIGHLHQALSFHSRVRFSSVLAANNGFGPGFDSVRVFLASAVIATHSIELTRDGIDNVILRYPTIFDLRFLVVPAFFSLSGFLVASSIFRVKNVRTFLTLRALRIFPALVVEVVLSALVLGFLVSTAPWSEYFSDYNFYLYIGNLAGIKIHYLLPGVFTENPSNYVNGSLWTVPAEMRCYLSLAVLMATSIIFRKRSLLTLLAFGSAAMMVAVYFEGRLFTHLETNNTRILLLCFYAGVCTYVFRDRIPHSFLLFLLSGALSLAAIWIPIVLIALGPMAITYVTCYFGLIRIPPPAPFRFGDYSYGMYLYGYPIQQTLVWITQDQWRWWENFGIAFMLSVIFAATSWHCIELRCLRLRHRFATTTSVGARAKMGGHPGTTPGLPSVTPDS